MSTTSETTIATLSSYGVWLLWLDMVADFTSSATSGSPNSGQDATMVRAYSTTPTSNKWNTTSWGFPTYDEDGSLFPFDMHSNTYTNTSYVSVAELDAFFASGDTISTTAQMTMGVLLYIKSVPSSGMYGHSLIHRVQWGQHRLLESSWANDHTRITFKDIVVNTPIQKITAINETGIRDCSINSVLIKIATQDNN